MSGLQKPAGSLPASAPAQPKARRGLWVLLGVVALDQASKLALQAFLVRSTCPPGVPHCVPLIDGVLDLRLALNTGAAFGLFAAYGSWITLVTAGVAGGILWALWRGWGGVFQIGLALVGGGAWGNLLDRLRLGHVVDFLDFKIWPVFNLADVAIVGGTALILLRLWRR